MHVRCPVGLPEEGYHRVLEVLDGFSPVVQVIPPGAALVELRGAVGYLGMDECGIAGVVRLRSVALLGVDLRIGIGTSWTVAATASGRVTGPGGVLAVSPESTEEWLATLPVEALHGIGPQHAATLRRYGIDTVALLAALPAGTVQRVPGPGGPPPSGRAAGTSDPSPPEPSQYP